MTTPSPLEIRNGLLLTLRASEFTPAGSFDESVVLRSGIVEAIEGLDAMITPEGDLSRPAKLRSRRGGPDWGKPAKAAKPTPGSAAG